MTAYRSLLAAALIAGAAQAGPYDAWTKYRSIAINTTAAGGGANVAGAVTNFPVLVRLTSDSEGNGSDVLSGALAAGADIRFTDSAGANALAYEIEHWSNNSAAIWVKVPAVAGNAVTTVRLYWGKSGSLSASSGAGVFDTANGFRAVFHLGEANDSVARNASGLGFTATPGSFGGATTPADTAGAIGRAKNFRGIGGTSSSTRGSFYQLVGSAASRLNFSTAADRYTLSAWVRVDSVPSNGSAGRTGILAKYGSAANQQYVLGFYGNSGGTGTCATAHKTSTSGEGGGWREVTGAQGCAVNAASGWVHLTAARTASSNTGTAIYLNGALITGSTGNENGATYSNTKDVFIGAFSDTARFFRGSIDEVRIDSTARSADWIKLNYETQKPGATALALGATQTQAPAVVAPGAPTGVNGVPGNAQVTVSWAAPASDGGAAISGYKVLTVSDTAKSCVTSGALTCAVTGLTNGTPYTFQVRATNSAGASPLSDVSGSVTPAMSVGNDYTAWTQTRPITLNTSAAGANVSATVLNFPVLVRLAPAESTVFAQAKAAGADIRFSKANNVGLPYQIERWDATAKRAEIWVLVDTVRGNNSTQAIKMYWGNASANSESNGGAVFTVGNGHRAVFHLADANDSTAKDATLNGYHAVPGNVGATNPVSTGGAIGTAKDFAGIGGTSSSGSYYKVANTNVAAPRLNFNTAGDAYSLSAWVRSDVLPAVGTAGRQGILAKYGSATNQQYVVGLWGSPSGTGATCATAHKMNATGGRYQEAQDCAANPGAWTHFTAIRTGTGTNSVELYVNGEVVGTEGAEGATNYSNTSDLFIGAFSDTTRFFDGAIDEVRLDSTARDADWIKLSYESQKPNQLLTNIGLFVASPPAAPTAVTALAGNAQATVSWSAPANNGGAAITAYKVTAVSDTNKSCTTTGALSCVVSGLTNATPYAFVVKATNSAGTSLASAPSTAVIPTSLKSGAVVFRVTGSGKAYAFQLPANATASTEAVTLSIVDAWGRTVWSKTILPSRTSIRDISWNGKASNGMQASAGMYVARLSIRREGKSVHLAEQTVTLAP